MIIKRLKILFFLLLIGSSTNAQDLPRCNGQFIKSFMQSFNLKEVDSLRTKPGYFFSVLIELNEQGLISLMEPNIALDTSFTKLVAKTLKNIDITSLKSCGFKSEAMVLPVFVFYDNPPGNVMLEYDVKHFTGLWSFKTESNKPRRFFDPLTVYYRGYKEPIKCYSLPFEPLKIDHLKLPPERL